jgi:threonine dehydratase
VSDRSTEEKLLADLEHETQLALDRIYEVDSVTPMESMMFGEGRCVDLKREDTSKVHSYKWRGSFNKIKSLLESGFSGSLVAASAGNHAQGVAIAAAGNRLNATIFMPLSTPVVKQDAVREFGGEFVEIRLVGDSFDESSAEAGRFAAETGAELIPPYDDLLVIAGQSTIGIEILQQLKHKPTHAFLPIGGGGMAAGVASVFKRLSPETKLIGVEAVDQDSMGISYREGERKTVGLLDRFCDGTAVAIPGKLPFEICRALINEFITVTNAEVCDAIQELWQRKRIIVEPSAALGMAALIKSDLQKDDRPVTVLSGSNVDFMMLPKIARRGQLNRPERRYVGYKLGEKPGELARLLERFGKTVNIIDFQYGKVSESEAYPIIGVEVPRNDIDKLDALLASDDLPEHFNVTGVAVIDFRVIPFNLELFRYPYFAVIQFPNRPGALREFMHEAGKKANVCYMNYTDDGQTEGFALMGFEFDDLGRQSEFIDWLVETTEFQPVPMDQVRHLNLANMNSDRFETLSPGGEK